jgi:hypothetical protein
MTAKGIERAAYIAAHRILEANTTATELVCPGARRSYTIDTIADIIREAFEPDNLEAQGLACLPEPKVATRLQVINHPRAGALLALSLRASPDEVA